MSGRALARDWFLEALDRETERRRQAALAAVGGDPRKMLEKTLAEMAARLRADPLFEEPSPAQQRRTGAKLDTWLRCRGYYDAPS